MGWGLNGFVLGALFTGAAVSGPSGSWAQDSAAIAPTAEGVTAVHPAKSIPPLTPVEIVLDVAMGSKLSKTGEIFSFHLAKPILLDGVEVVPAGTTGEGEVIHAKKGGGGGAPGELVLAARFLQVGNRQLRLRSLKLDAIGMDKMGTVNAINAAAAATIPVAGMIGLFITGGEKVLAKGTILPAKTAEAFAIEQPGLDMGAAHLEESAGDGAGTEGKGN